MAERSFIGALFLCPVQHPYNQNHMANVAIGFGALLTALGVFSYLGTGAASPTALIPAAFGLILLVLGVLARDPAKRKSMMHFAAGIGVLGFAGSAPGLMKSFRMLGGETVERPNAVVAQAFMAVLCLAFVALCVRSFISARRSRVAEGTRTSR